MNNSEKPVAKVTGRDGNIFITLGICTTSLKKAGFSKQVDELINRVFNADSYENALAIMREYCELQ